MRKKIDKNNKNYKTRYTVFLGFNNVYLIILSTIEFFRFSRKPTKLKEPRILQKKLSKHKISLKSIFLSIMAKSYSDCNYEF